MKRLITFFVIAVFATTNFMVAAQPTQALTCRVLDPYYVTQVQKALTGKGFNPGTADGYMGPKTCTAIVSFQKSRRLTPDGIVGSNTGRALGLSTAIKCENGAVTCFLAVERTGYQGTVYAIRNNVVIKKLVATFGSRLHKDGGDRTPVGKFTITRDIAGAHTSSLYPSENPNMNYPLYFNGTIAIHGSAAVGQANGSHGCIRIGWSASKDIYYNYYKKYGIKTVVVRR